MNVASIILIHVSVRWTGRGKPPEMISEVLDVMVDLARDGMTMICVTHEMGFARSVADRVMFMDGGQLIEEGDPETFFANPRNERTALFLRQILRH